MTKWLESAHHVRGDFVNALHRGIRGEPLPTLETGLRRVEPTEMEREFWEIGRLLERRFMAYPMRNDYLPYTNLPSVEAQRPEEV